MSCRNYFDLVYDDKKTFMENMEYVFSKLTVYYFFEILYSII